MVERSSGERGKVSVTAKTHSYGKAIHITGMGSWSVGPRLAAEVVVAMREGQHKPFGAKDLWVEVARRSAGRRAWTLCPTSPADNRGTQPWAGETTVHEIWAQAAVNRDCIEGIGGVRAGLIRWSLANTAVWDLHLSPDGGKHHVRWGGGGQETGARAQASSACGLTQGQRWTQSTRACLLPDHVLDQAWAKRGRGRLVRYADDGVVLCGSREEAEAALELVRDVLCELGLELHPEKTRIVDLSEGREGFDFLGCHFHARVSGSMLERGIRRYYLHRWPSARSMKRVRQRVKELTGRNRNGVRDVRVLIKDLNPVLRGWGNYFRTGNAALKFNQLDRYVVSRLHRFLVKRHGRNLRHGRADQWTREWFWQLGLHRFRGTVRYPTAA